VWLPVAQTSIRRCCCPSPTRREFPIVRAGVFCARLFPQALRLSFALYEVDALVQGAECLARALTLYRASAPLPPAEVGVRVSRGTDTCLHDTAYRGQTWPLSIAPMMDRTDRHYRYFMRQITRHTLLYTEMITTAALIHGTVTGC